MAQIPTSLMLAWVCFSITTTASAGEEPHAEKSHSLVVQRDSIVDFHTFLEAIKLLVPQRGSALEITLGSGDRKLSFITWSDNAGEPLLIHISPNKLATGSGAGRHPLTVEELRKNLELLAQAATAAGAKGAVALVSDKEVSGDFGFLILNTIRNSGISVVELSRSEILEPPAPTPRKKPSSPSSR